MSVKLNNHVAVGTGVNDHFDLLGEPAVQAGPQQLIDVFLRERLRLNPLLEPGDRLRVRRTDEFRIPFLVDDVDINEACPTQVPRKDVELLHTLGLGLE